MLYFLGKPEFLAAVLEANFGNLFHEGGLRTAAVEDVRDALTSMSTHLSEASARQYVLRIKSLLGYAHALGYTPFNAGATITQRPRPCPQCGLARTWPGEAAARWVCAQGTCRMPSAVG
jgi:hypothetical protein